MSTLNKLIFFAISALLLLSITECGTISLNLPKGFRNGREIRAPFKNSEIMVARGFGKRDVRTHPSDKLFASLGEQEDESIPVEWIAREVSSNPSLARLVLRRFVDSNKDGMISAPELLGTSAFNADSEFY